MADLDGEREIEEFEGRCRAGKRTLIDRGFGIRHQELHAVAQRENVDMPLCEGIYRILYEQRSAKEIVRELMTRPIRPENE